MQFFTKFTKKNKILILLLFVLIVFIIMGATYAFLTTRIGTEANTDIDLMSKEGTKLVFTSGDSINLIANKNNFGENSGNLTAETISSVTHIPSTDAVNHVETYNVFMNISNNNFEYTVDSNTPELILTILDNENNPITNIDGLNYVTVTDALTGEIISGFDITTKQGLIKIKENAQILASYPTESQHNWTAKITFVNLNINQRLNEGKKFNAKFVLQGETITMTSQLLSIQDETNGLIQHTESNVKSAQDNNYRYSGGNDVVNNYVCFGSDEEVCPVDNLYRIIGSYNIDGEYLLKLVKNLYADENQDDLFSVLDKSRFHTNANIVFEGYDVDSYEDDPELTKYLNDVFYNEFSIEYQNMIQETKYNIGDIKTGGTDKETFEREIKTQTILKYKIGLVAASDYMYATSENNWNLNDFSLEKEAFDNNWLALLFTFDESSSSEISWIINQLNGTTSHFAAIHYGSLSWFNYNESLYVVPSFYLKSNIEIVSGDGKIDNPFRLSM